MRFALILLVVAASSICAQVGRGTLFQSISPVQISGVSQVGLPGNPSITTNEVLAWSRTDAPGGCRALYNAQELGIAFGDINGDGFPFDWPNIDAIALNPVAPIPLNGQPSPYDFLFSVDTDVRNILGVTLVRAGDVVRLTGVGRFQIVVPETAFQAALGTSQRLNLDALTVNADGSMMVSFRGNGTGNNIINPLSGSPGNTIAWSGADLFTIRAPFGALPAIFAWRSSDLQTITSQYGYPALTEVVGCEVQPGTPLLVNPWDPTRLYQGGGRPFPLWLVENDDNVFCLDRTRNPLTSANHYYAIVGSGTGSVAGYQTNGPSFRVLMDAFCIGDFDLGTETRLTLDVDSLVPAGGSTVTLFARSPDAAGTIFQCVVSTRLELAGGFPLGSAFGRLLVAASDPIFQFAIDPAVAPFLQTMAASASGTGATAALTLPNAPGASLYFQAIKIGGSYPISGPTVITIQ